MLYRITSEIDTIPSSLNQALGGTVTSNSTNAKVLSYTGSNDVGVIYAGGNISKVDGPYWIYVVGVSPFLARVVGVYQLANNTWQITLDRPFPGATGAACKWLFGPAWYNFNNDGGHDINVTDGEMGSGVSIVVHTGTTVAPKGYQLNVQRVKLYAPVYIDASSSSVLCEVQL